MAQFYKYSQSYNGLSPDTVYSGATNQPIKSPQEYSSMGGKGDFSDVEMRDLPTSNLTTGSGMTSSNSSTLSNTTNPFSDALTKLMSAYQPTPEYTQTLSDISNLKRGYQQADLNLRDNSQNPVAMPILRGQQAIAQELYNIQQETLQDKLARLQTERGFNIDAANALVNAYKPQEVGLGGSLLQRNAQGGFDTVGQGQSYIAKLSATTTQDLIRQYPDAGIQPTDDPTTAAYLAGKSQSFGFKNTQKGFDPVQGQVTTLKGIDQSKIQPPATSFGNSGTSNSGSNLGTSQGGGFYKIAGDANPDQVYNSAGQPVSYEQYIAQGGNSSFKGITTRGSSGTALGKNNTGSTSQFATVQTPTGPIGLNKGTAGLSKMQIQDATNLLNGGLIDSIPTNYGRQANAIAAAQQMSNGLYDPSAVKAGQKFQADPETQKAFASANIALNTIKDPKAGVIALSDKVPRGSVKLLNNGQLALASNVSDKNTANFLNQVNLAADEISKVLGSGSGSDFTIQMGQKLIDPNYSQDTFNSVMNDLAGRLQNKLEEYKKQSYQNPLYQPGTTSTNSIQGNNVNPQGGVDLSDLFN